MPRSSTLLQTSTAASAPRSEEWRPYWPRRSKKNATERVCFVDRSQSNTTLSTKFTNYTKLHETVKGPIDESNTRNYFPFFDNRVKNPPATAGGTDLIVLVRLLYRD